MNNICNFRKKKEEKKDEKILEMTAFSDDLRYLISIHMHKKTEIITMIGGLILMLGKLLAKHDPTASNTSLRNAVFKSVMNHHGKEIINNHENGETYDNSAK
jgi:hypothetical protein